MIQGRSAFGMRNRPNSTAHDTGIAGNNLTSAAFGWAVLIVSINLLMVSRNIDSCASDRRKSLWQSSIVTSQIAARPIKADSTRRGLIFALSEMIKTGVPLLFAGS